MTRSEWIAGVGAVVLVVAAAATWWWWGWRAPVPVEVASPDVSTAPARSASEAQGGALGPVEVAAPEPAVAEAPLQAAGIDAAFAELLGAETAKRWLRGDEFARRVVTTVDNLGREHAPSMWWPVDPTAGRFAVVEREGRTMIDPANAARYEPFVRFVEGVDSVAAVGLYVRLLPLLQQAYEDLGYPRRRFHTRLLNVIDHLLAAPQAPEWIEVQLTQVRGPIAPTRPWVRYEFADAALQSASAGHKIMTRIGPAHQRRLKAKLAELRTELLRRAER